MNTGDWIMMGLGILNMVVAWPMILYGNTPMWAWGVSCLILGGIICIVVEVENVRTDIRMAGKANI